MTRPLHCLGVATTATLRVIPKSLDEEYGTKSARILSAGMVGKTRGIRRWSLLSKVIVIRQKGTAQGEAYYDAPEGL